MGNSQADWWVDSEGPVRSISVGKKKNGVNRDKRKTI